MRGMPELEKKDDKVNVVGLLAFFGVMGLFQLAAGLFMLALMYGVVVIIFRMAFHVELWNPFH
jgi:hypothetical protein